MGKGEIPHFPVFSTLFENFQQFSSNLKLLSANSFSLEESKICHLGETLNMSAKSIYPGQPMQSQGRQTWAITFCFLVSFLPIRTILPLDLVVKISESRMKRKKVNIYAAHQHF